MKNIIGFFISFLFIVLLSGCGADGSGAGGASGMAGGGNDAGMGTAGGLPIGGDGSMGGSMDIGALMGGLMGGDDDDGESGGNDGATNTAPQAFTPLGQVGISYEGTQYQMLAASSRDRQDMIVPNYTPDVNGTNIVQIAAYDIREERLHEDTGSLIFSFRMADLGEAGSYPLITTVEGESGTVIIDSTYSFNGKVKLRGRVEGATLYSPSQDSFFTFSMQFQEIAVSPAQTQQPQQ